MISPFHNEPSQANRISDSLNHRDSSSSQGVAIHDGRVILDLAFKVQCRSSSSVENGVVFHRNCCDFNGVGCDPFNIDAVQRLMAIKKRTGAPLPILVASLERARQIGSFNAKAECLARAFWPGALTLVVPDVSNLPVEVTGSNGTVGLRVPNRSDTRNLIVQSGGAIVGTSANISGNPSLTTAKEVEVELGATVD